MRTVLLTTAVVLGLGNASIALADSPGQGRSEQLVVQANQTQADSVGEVKVQKVAEERVVVKKRSGSNAGWLLAGAAGAVVPLVLFALPALWLAWFGPFAPLAFIAAMAVGTVATGLGGAVSWLLSAMFSDLKSGFLVPILGSAAFGLGATFLSGVLSAGIIWAGIGLGWLTGGARNMADAVFRPDVIQRPFATLSSTIMVLSVGLGFIAWTTGVLTASIGGPMVAAFLYRANGVPKYTEAAVPVSRDANTYRETYRETYEDDRLDIQ